MVLFDVTDKNMINVYFEVVVDVDNDDGGID